MAANEAMLLLPMVVPALRGVPWGVNTALASGMYTAWRTLLMPVDTAKTLLQVEGDKGMKIILDQVMICDDM